RELAQTRVLVSVGRRRELDLALRLREPAHAQSVLHAEDERRGRGCSRGDPRDRLATPAATSRRCARRAEFRAPVNRTAGWTATAASADICARTASGGAVVRRRHARTDLALD